jgi:hypothetical protein
MKTSKLVQLHNTNQRNAQFSKSILNSVVPYIFRTSRVNPQEDSCICSTVRFTCIVVSSLAGRRVCTSVLECVRDTLQHTRTYSPILCIYNCFPGDEPTMFERRKRRQKLNINSENCPFRWSVLCNYIAVHKANNIKF